MQSLLNETQIYSLDENEKKNFTISDKATNFYFAEEVDEPVLMLTNYTISVNWTDEFYPYWER